MDKYDYRNAIVSELRGTTSLQFQFKVREVLKRYYAELGKTYEMPSPYGGDDKNDGWVVEDAIFYQIYSPTQLKNTLAKNIQDKFESDLVGLIEKLKEGKWNGKLNKFIFLVNTFDVTLPKDPDRFFENLTESIKEKYDIEFDYVVSNLDYISDLLIKINNIDVLQDIASVLKVNNIIPVESITERILFDTIEAIASNLSGKFIGTLNFKTYQRISTIKKIYINKLVDKKDEIELYLKNLDVVESAVGTVNQDMQSSILFERVVNFIIDKYKTLSCEYNGVELLEEIYRQIHKHTLGEGFTEAPLKLLIVYVFDKCDIFEREEGEEDDIAK